MRVMTYNTLYGGIDGNDERRRNDQIAIVRETDPDVLLFQEAKGYSSAGGALLYATEQAIGMRGFVAEAPVTGQHTAIFIKPALSPMTFEADAAHFHHAAALLRFRAPGFDKPVTAMSVHLCPNGPDVRIREASYLVNHAVAEDFVLVAGDFNSVSPSDSEPDGLDDLPARFRVRYVSDDGRADRRALSLLTNAGYVDLAVKLSGNNVPTVPGLAFKNSEFVPFRSDYVLATEALAARASAYRVIRTPLTDVASDHYPIVVELTDTSQQESVRKYRG